MTNLKDKLKNPSRRDVLKFLGLTFGAGFVGAATVRCCSDDEDPSRGGYSGNVGDDDSFDGEEQYFCEGMEVNPATKILSPQHNAIYYTSPILNLNGNKTHSGKISLDDELINRCPGEMLEDVSTGVHHLSFYREGNVVDEVTFKIDSEENIINSRNITELPTEYELNNNGNGSTLVSLRVENNGDRVNLLRFYGSQQPDLQNIHDAVNFIIGSETDPEKQAILIYNWHVNKVINLYPAIDGIEGTQWPTQATNLGYAICGNKAAFLRNLWEANGFSSRTWALNGHLVSEVCWEEYCEGSGNEEVWEGWHMMDSYDAAFYRSKEDVHILSVPEIMRNPELMRAYTDQMGKSLGGVWGSFIEEYATTEDNRIDSHSPPGDGAGPGIDMQRGDVLTLFPRGFNTYFCENCEQVPKIVGTGIHKRKASLDGQKTTTALPFIMNRASVSLDQVEPINNAGKATLDFTVYGTAHGQPHQFEGSITQEINQKQKKVFFDIYKSLNKIEIGIVTKIDTQITLEGLIAASGEITSVFQFAPRLMQISESDYMLKALGEANGNLDLDLTVKTYGGKNVIDPSKNKLSNLISGQLYVPANGTKMARLMAEVKDHNGDLAGGNKLELVCDNPDSDVEIFGSSNVGVDEYASVPQASHLPPNYWAESSSEEADQRAFYLRSSGFVGDVTCEMYINDEPSGEKETVHFTSP